ncbi:MAG: methyltransferase [Pseudonocardiaceae bacterium]|nr:methyltransferase [Pseudonocardiaceae bacterium]
MSRKATVVDDQAVTAEVRGNIVRLVFGHMAAQVVGTAVRFRLPDLIGDRERTAAELAEECGTQPQAMTRLLRAMAALELLAENRPGHFSLAAGGMLLRTDRPDSLHALAGMFTDPAMLQSWQRLESSVRTGETAFDQEFGTDFFDYLKTRPELSALFNAAMSQGAQLTASVTPASYDFGRFDTVVDIGGGDGTLISAILREYPALNGILFDTAEGLAQAEQTLRSAEVTERCAVRAGDFFASVPEGGDLYLLKSVIHDWDDERAASILGHCRRVIPEHGRLLIVEPVLPEAVDGSNPAIMYLSDLNMLVNLGGRERTRGDFEELYRRAGFELTSVTPLPPPAGFCLVEAKPS